MLARREHDQLKLLAHRVQELLREGPDVKYELERQALLLLLRRLTPVLTHEFRRQFIEIGLLLCLGSELALVLHVRVDQRLVEVQHEGVLFGAWRQQGDVDRGLHVRWGARRGVDLDELVLVFSRRLKVLAHL